ncbi:MAG: hypothetical protein DMG74_16925 [Acidobacteria bacterium]|nr:MAG: hypothetical protein DMG74_16925 [Acidobacteriota bacterium]
MSKNFELLERAGKATAIFSREAVATRLPEEPSVGGMALWPQERKVEEIAKLVQRVFLIPKSETPRTVVLTATESGAGCSWICSGVAEFLTTQVNGTVCVVDANFHSPRLHRHFGVENHNGLSDALVHSDPIREFVRPLSQLNLWLVSCGSEASERQGLLSSDRMSLRLSELRAEFDYVLLDTAPLSQSTDALVLGASADGVILVLKAHSSRRQAARKAVSDLRAANAQVLGAVLNQRTFPIPESIYKKL